MTKNVLLGSLNQNKMKNWVSIGEGEVLGNTEHIKYDEKCIVGSLNQNKMKNWVSVGEGGVLGNTDHGCFSFPVSKYVWGKYRSIDHMIHIPHTQPEIEI